MNRNSSNVRVFKITLHTLKLIKERWQCEHMAQVIEILLEATGLLDEKTHLSTEHARSSLLRHMHVSQDTSLVESISHVRKMYKD